MANQLGLGCLGDYDSVMWHTLLEDLLGGVPILSKEELCQTTSQAHLLIARGGLGSLSTTVLAPITFWGSFALTRLHLSHIFSSMASLLVPFYAMLS